MLERLDELEDILLSRQSPQSPTGPIQTFSKDASPEFHRLCISIVDVLSWPVFGGQFSAYLDIESLLRVIPLEEQFILRHQITSPSMSWIRMRA